VKTRKLLIILLVAVLLVVYYLLGMDYLKQRNEHEALASQITDAAQTLAQMPEPPDDLEPRLAAARASLDETKKSFPDKMNSTGIVNTILKLADNCEVKAIPLITRPWTTRDFSGHSYSVFRLTVAVTGTFAQLVSFLSKLENGELQTLVVEDLSVTRVTQPPGGEGAAAESVPVHASLDLAIYTRPLTSE
jgi:Tfp pilus assembly protein PilO